MATFSYTVQDLLMFGLDDPLSLRYDELIEKGMNNIFRFSYPIFDESYRKPLQTNILKAYLDREIGLETPEAFVLYLDGWFNRMMPFYNDLYKSTLFKYDLFKNYWQDEKSTTTTDGTNKQIGTRTSDSTDASTTVHSDTPQGILSNKAYASSADKSNGTSTQNDNISNNTTIQNTDDYVRHVEGYNGKSYPELILDFRKTLISVDNLIIDALAPVFHGIYLL